MATTTSGTDGADADAPANIDNDVATGNTPGSVEPTQTDEAVKDEPAQAEDSTSQEEQTSDDAVSEESTPAEAKAADDKTDDEIIQWAEKKGLKINPDNPNEIRLARLNLENDRKFHESTQTKSAVQPPEEVPLTGNEALDEVVARQNRAEMQLYVRDWFDANPDMKEHRQDLMKIATDRPWLQNLDDVRAHFLADPSRADQLKQEGGKQALTNLAQKQQARPPAANATNAGVFESTKITSQNVDELVAKNDDAWYNAHRDEILQAAYGNTRT